MQAVRRKMKKEPVKDRRKERQEENCRYICKGPDKGKIGEVLPTRWTVIGLEVQGRRKQLTAASSRSQEGVGLSVSEQWKATEGVESQD